MTSNQASGSAVNSGCWVHIGVEGGVCGIRYHFPHLYMFVTFGLYHDCEDHDKSLR